MVMLTPSQSHSGGALVKPHIYRQYCARIAISLSRKQEKKILDWVAHGNPVIVTSNYPSDALLSEMADMNDGNTRVTGAALGYWCLSLFCPQIILFTYKKNNNNKSFYLKIVTVSSVCLIDFSACCLCKNLF